MLGALRVLELDLAGNGIGDVGTCELARALAGLRLVKLMTDFRGNVVRELGMRELARSVMELQAGSMKKLELHLDGNGRAGGAEMGPTRHELARAQQLQATGCLCECSW